MLCHSSACSALTSINTLPPLWESHTASSLPASTPPLFHFFHFRLISFIFSFIFLRNLYRCLAHAPAVTSRGSDDSRAVSEKQLTCNWTRCSVTAAVLLKDSDCRYEWKSVVSLCFPLVHHLFIFFTVRESSNHPASRLFLTARLPFGR